MPVEESVHSPCTFKPVDGEEIYSEFDSGYGMPNRSTLVEYGDAGLLELRDDWAGTVASCFDNADTLIDDGLRICVIVWRDERGQQCQIDPERIARHLSAPANLFPQFLGSWEDQCCDDAQTTRIRDGRCQLSVACPAIISSKQDTAGAREFLPTCIIPPCTTGTIECKKYKALANL